MDENPYKAPQSAATPRSLRSIQNENDTFALVGCALLMGAVFQLFAIGFVASLLMPL